MGANCGEKSAAHRHEKPGALAACVEKPSSPPYVGGNKRRDSGTRRDGARPAATEDFDDHPLPAPPRQALFTDPHAAWAHIAEIYHRNCNFIRGHLEGLSQGVIPPGRVRPTTAQVEVRSTSYSKHESTLPYGYLHTPGLYRTTVTAPDLFKGISRNSSP